MAMADPGQDPRDSPDIATLWSILDLTPSGRPAKCVSQAQLLTPFAQAPFAPSARG